MATFEELKRANLESFKELDEIRKKFPDFADFKTPPEGIVHVYVNGKIDVKYSDGHWERDLYGFCPSEGVYIWSRQLETKIREHQNANLLN